MRRAVSASIVFTILGPLFCLGPLFWSGAALAFSHPEGTYKRLGAQSETVKIEPLHDGFHVDVTVVTPTCGGHIVGEASMINATEMLLRATDPYAGPKACSVHLDFAKDFSTLDLRESDCGYYHGTACKFDGHTLRIARHPRSPKMSGVLQHP